jgi:hypothetical protein
MIISLFQCYYAQRRWKEMVMKSYLDALTPGMRARLDPSSRIPKEERTERWASVTRNEPEATSSKYTLRLGHRTTGRVAGPQFPALKK